MHYHSNRLCSQSWPLVSNTASGSLIPERKYLFIDSDFRCASRYLEVQMEVQIHYFQTMHQFYAAQMLHTFLTTCDSLSSLWTSSSWSELTTTSSCPWRPSGRTRSARSRRGRRSSTSRRPSSAPVRQVVRLCSFCLHLLSNSKYLFFLRYLLLIVVSYPFFFF